MDFKRKERYDIADLRQILELLRSENGCPWDRAQTHESIRGNLIEETYEAVEAIDRKDSALLREELGDVLLQLVFHARMEEEEGRFDFDDVVNDLCEKLIIRHPHVFAGVRVNGVEDVLDHWNAIKRQTKGQRTVSETLDAVPRQLPALMRSAKVQSRAGKGGMDYPDAGAAFADLQSEVRELAEAMAADDAAAAAEELGDVLFAAVNVARFARRDPEELLTRSCDKFIARFRQTELLAREQGVELANADAFVRDALWKAAKLRIQEDADPHEEY